jgi:Tol biopolymer transport system component
LVDASDTYTDAATINVVGVNGGGGTSVATSGWTQRPQWSPDGRWIAFQAGRSEAGSLSLRIVHPSGRGFRLLATDASGFAWSPDAKHLVFSHSHYTGGSWIDIVNIDSRRRVQLAQFGGDVIDAVAWAPNRSQIAVISGWITMDGSATEKIHVYLVNTKTGAERVGGSLGVTDADGLAWLNKASKKLVVFDNFGVYLTSTTGRQMRQVSTDGCCAEPSPNGREVLTVGYGSSTDKTALFVQDINGAKKQLTQVK